jgi:hypothetical protein
MFACLYIFITDQELWSRKLVSHIMSHDHSLDRKDILKSILLFYDPI